MTDIQVLRQEDQNADNLEEGEIYVSEIRHRFIVCVWRHGQSDEMEPYVDFDTEDEAKEAVLKARRAT